MDTNPQPQRKVVDAEGAENAARERERGRSKPSTAQESNRVRDLRDGRNPSDQQDWHRARDSAEGPGRTAQKTHRLMRPVAGSKRREASRSNYTPTRTAEEHEHDAV